MQIKFKATRSEIITVLEHYYPYINLLRQTNLKDAQGDEKLLIILGGDLLQSVEDYLKKKLFNRDQKEFTIGLPRPHAIILLITLQKIPIHETEVYLLWLRNLWMNYIYSKIYS